MVSALGLVGGLALLILLTVRGVNIVVAAVVSAALVAATAGVAWLPPLAQSEAPDFATAYMAGFTSFFADWFPMFLLGAVFGEIMARTGAADSVALAITGALGPRYAAFAVVLACAVLTYGGVSVFIVAFAVYPMALSLFRRADMPRRFIPACLAFGSVTFTMTTAGSPEIQNIIPQQYLGTKAWAGWQVSLPVAVLMAAIGFFWLSRMMRKAKARGERFEAREDDERREHDALPAWWLSLLPLVVVLGVFLLTQEPGWIGLSGEGLGKWGLVVALGAGCVAASLLAIRDLPALAPALSIGATGAVIAIVNTCAVVGFGSVAKLSPAFLSALSALETLPGDPLIGAAIAVTVIAALTGSASGGQTIALPLIAPGYIEAGVDPSEFHRTVAIASGALDSLPHNGYVVTTIRAICGETHAAAYPALGALTVVVPLIGLVVAIGLFVIF
ncbi:GntP family permease [Parvularcula oceani]|uniref:GntP family permease n=1 Tax=Parvularcula oceani TaxID=1247963 RepID=UPI0004E0F8B4|nr:GntP family permease [Parvularcula oceani]